MRRQVFQKLQNEQFKIKIRRPPPFIPAMVLAKNNFVIDVDP